MGSSSSNDGKSSGRTRRARFRATRLLFEKRIALFAVLAALPGICLGTIVDLGAALAQ